MNTIKLNIGSGLPIQNAFDLELLDVMDNLEYRRITSVEDFEAIGRLRQKAFDAYEIYERKFGADVIEDIDFDPLTTVFGVYFRGELASTIRIKRVTPKNRVSTAMHLFSSVLNPMLDQGMNLIDPSRLATNVEISKTVPGLSILTTRLAIIASLHYKVDFLLFACKQEHLAFYRRVFRATQLAGPFKPDGMNVKAVLLGKGISGQEELFTRYPVFRFKETEGRLLFDPPINQTDAMCVMPTARLALKAA